jgi:hypothetical protein
LDFPAKNHLSTGYTPTVFSLAVPIRIETATESRTIYGVPPFVVETILFYSVASLAVRQEKVVLACGLNLPPYMPHQNLIYFEHEHFSQM